MTPQEIGINRITPSGLMMYESCPKAFYYCVYLGLKLPQSMVHFEFGTAIHDAIAVMYAGRKEDGTWDNVSEKAAFDALTEFNKKFTIESCKDLTINENGRTRPMTGQERIEKFKEMSQDGFELLKAYWQEKEILLAKGFDPIQFEIPGKDVVYNPETKEPLPIPLSYRLDAILRGHGVGEFKTSSKPYDNFETRARSQSLCYIWAYWHKYQTIPVLHYVVLIKKRKKDKLQHLMFDYDMGDILEFDARVRSILEQIKNREFNAPVRGHDRFCDCRKYDELLKID